MGLKESIDLSINLNKVYETFMDEVIMFTFKDSGTEYLAVFCDYEGNIVSEGELEKEYYLVSDISKIEKYTDDIGWDLHNFYNDMWLKGKLYYMEKLGDKMVSKQTDDIGSKLPDKGYKYEIEKV